MASIRFALVVTLIGACGSSAPAPAKSAPSGMQCPSNCSQDSPERQPVSPKPQQSFSVDTARVVVPVETYMPNISVYADDAEERLYWVDYMGVAGYMSLSDGSIKKLTVNPSKFALNSEDFAVGSQHLFVTSKELSAIVVVDKNQAAILKSIPTKSFVTDVATTTERVYWIDQNGLHSTSIDGEGTPTDHGHARDKDTLKAAASYALLNTAGQELHLLSNGTMKVLAKDVTHVSIWMDEVFIVKSGGTRVEVHSGPEGPTEYDFDLDESSDLFAVGAGGICSLHGATITCYDHGSGKRVLAHTADSSDSIGHLAVSRRLVFWSTTDKHEIWAAPLP